MKFIIKWLKIIYNNNLEIIARLNDFVFINLSNFL